MLDKVFELIHNGMDAEGAVDSIALESYADLGVFVKELAEFVYSSDFEGELVELLAKWAEMAASEE